MHRPWSEVAQEEARTFVFADGQYVEPGQHPVEISRTVEHQTRWARRRAKTNANIGLMRLLFRAVREALHERKMAKGQPLDL